MRTIKKVVITSKEWEILSKAADLLEAWLKNAPKEDRNEIEEMFETIGEKYEGYSYIDIVRNTLNDVCDEIEVE